MQAAIWSFPADSSRQLPGRVHPGHIEATKQCNVQSSTNYGNSVLHRWMTSTTAPTAVGLPMFTQGRSTPRTCPPSMGWSRSCSPWWTSQGTWCRSPAGGRSSRPGWATRTGTGRRWARPTSPPTWQTFSTRCAELGLPETSGLTFFII